jgi:hypothetical protein
MPSSKYPFSRHFPAFLFPLLIFAGLPGSSISAEPGRSKNGKVKWFGEYGTKIEIKDGVGLLKF